MKKFLLGCFVTILSHKEKTKDNACESDRWPSLYRQKPQSDGDKHISSLAKQREIMQTIMNTHRTMKYTNPCR